MVMLRFEGGLPDPKVFRQRLSQALVETNPVDDLLTLSNQLHGFEQHYQISSDDFYQRYQEGELDDELQHCIEWAATYELFIKTRRALEATLMRAAVQPELSEVLA